MSGRRTAGAGAGERIFGVLLRLLPARFRERFGGEMAADFRAERREALSRGRERPARFWARTAWSVLVTAPREHWNELVMDLRYAARAMRRQPVFTLTVALSLAVGIGATATVIAVFGATFGRTAPGVRAPEALVNVKLKTAGDEDFRRASYPQYRDLRARGLLAGLGGFNGLRFAFATGADETPTFVFGQVVSGDYFSVVGTRPRLGRLLEPTDEATPQPVAVISSHLWQERFAADAGALGSTIRLNGQPFTVVGVAEEGFRGHFIGFNFDLFVPLSMAAVAGLPALEDRAPEWVELVGRLAGDGDRRALEQARAGFAVLADALAAAHPNSDRELEVVLERYDGFDADLRGGLAAFVAILFGVATFVLMIACVNVANLMLGRVVRRGREMSVRMALGAPRARLARQLLTESVAIALLAGVLGSLLALWATALARRALPDFGGGITLDVRVDPATVLAAFAVTLVAALGFGLVPALRGSRADLATFVRGDAAATGSGRLRGALVVAQVVLSLVILISAGLFVRALRHAQGLDPGFDAGAVLGVRLDPTLAGMDETATPALFERLLQRLADEPAVEAAGFTDRVPLGLGARFFANTVELAIPGHQPPPERAGFAVEHAAVSPGFLRALGIPLLAGRDLRPREDGGAIVNRTFAERYFGGGDGALGAIVRLDGEPLEIVGVAGDSRYRTLEEAPIPFVYLPMAKTAPDAATLMLRPAAGSAPDAIATTVRDRIRELAPALPVGTVERLERTLAVSFVPQRIAAAVAGAMGLIGLFMTALGLYGVLSYSVSCRQAEIGVRMSLGAGPREVVRLILRQALGLALLGLAIGIPLALLVSRLLAAFLYGLSPLDPLTYLAIAGLIALTAALAAFLPARRAARIDPLAVLRAS